MMNGVYRVPFIRIEVAPRNCRWWKLLFFSSMFFPVVTYEHEQWAWATARLHVCLVSSHIARHFPSLCVHTLPNARARYCMPDHYQTLIQQRLLYTMTYQLPRNHQTLEHHHSIIWFMCFRIAPDSLPLFILHLHLLRLVKLFNVYSILVFRWFTRSSALLMVVLPRVCT